MARARVGSERISHKLHVCNFDHLSKFCPFPFDILHMSVIL